MIDAPLVQAPSSTKNKSGKRDPEMHSTRKNNQYHFDMKIHIGSNVNSNVIHNLLRKEDEVIFADADYNNSDSYKRGACDQGIIWISAR